MTTDKLTITLTNRAPVTITTADWPEIATAKNWTRLYDSQASRMYHHRLTVLQHADGRAIVYGAANTQWHGDRAGIRAGKLCAAGEDLVAAIKEVAANCGCEQVAAECIADLPAKEV